MSIWKSKSKCFLEIILSKINKSCFVNDEKLCFKGFDSISWIIYLSEILNMPNNVDDTKFIKEVIKKTIENKKTVSLENFEFTFNSECKNLKEVMFKRYKGVIPLNFKVENNFQFEIENKTISIIRSNYEEKELIKELDIFSQKSISVIQNKCINDITSADECFELLDYIRAIHYLSSQEVWSLNLSDSSYISAPIPLPPSKKVFIFREYEEEPRPFVRSLNLSHDEPVSLKLVSNNEIININTVINNINKIYLQDNVYYLKIKHSILQFIQAIDSIAVTNPLPLLWGALETLLKNNENNYNLFVERISSLYSCQIFGLGVIEIIKNHRNDYTHNGIYDSEKMHLFAQTLYRLFKFILFYHIDNALNGYSFDYSLSLLKLPSKRELIKNKKEYLNKTITLKSPHIPE